MPDTEHLLPWHPASERPDPKVHKWVLVISYDRTALGDRDFPDIADIGSDGTMYTNVPGAPKWWMPIPEAPREKEETR